MKSINYIVVVLFVALFMSSPEAFSQKPAVHQNYAMFRKAAYGGISINTNGWGGSFNYSKHHTAKVKRLYTVDFSFLKHPKEYKIYNPLDENSKSYIFGKLNSLATLDLGWGQKKIFYEKLRGKGVQVSGNWSIGPSLGFIKPIYLEILKFDGIQVIAIAQEKYDPEAHNLTNIYGRAPNSKGITEMKFAPGVFIKGGLNFEFSPDHEGIKALEIGAKVTGYPKRVPVMAEIDNDFLFVEMYISLQIGKKFI
jgi:hypothetical protein